MICQGPGGLIITAFTIIAALTEAVFALYNVLYASNTWENTVKYVTEGGQVLAIYLCASFCGLVSALKRRDQDIINILKAMPLQEQYKSSVAYRKIFFKVLLLVPFFLFNFLFTEGKN
ncbi:hypothetical protein O3M35_005524 [Rhynocoris fuscipes]|uniref:Uncharacterized protein n=1 Tax=Rhynocoris fuscipes TaxID=488301 RepID=A0AAW1DIY8_9HEMI